MIPPHVPPSLGRNALAVWRKWRELTEEGGENARIEALSVGAGVYQWREGKLWKLTRAERIPFCAPVAVKEEDELWDALCKGWVQVYLPAYYSVYKERVLHQSTGTPMPESEE